MACILMDKNVKPVDLIAIQAYIQLVILQLALASMGVKQDGSVTDVILTVMLLTARHVLLTILTYVMNVMMDFIVIQIPLVSLVQIIALADQYVISETVLVAVDAMKIGQENSAIYHAHPTADSATSITNHLVHCAKTNFTVTAVDIHAVQDVQLKTDRIPAINIKLHVIMTVKIRIGVAIVKTTVGRAAVQKRVIDRRDIALVSALKHTSDRCVTNNAAKIVTLQRHDLVTKLTAIV